MNKSYKQIPLILENKTIAFTGTFPGVGKSYTYVELAKQLKVLGYRVFETGTTQKAASVCGASQTVASLSLNSKDNWHIKAGKTGNSVHTQTNGFYLIDEAFMMDQDKLDELKAAYPKCCFILFGDPMQFEPASGNKPIHNLDLIISLEKMMRCKDKDLIDALQTVKNGKVPVEFLYKHCGGITSDMLMLCYKKATSFTYSSYFEDKVGTLYRSMKRASYKDEENTEHYSVFNEVCNGDIWKLKEITNNYDETIESYNLYTLEKISGQRKEITVDYDDFKHHFEIKAAVNCHRVQGDTIRNDASDVIVWFDDGISSHNQTFLRFLYVALSRVEYSNQLHFEKTNLENALKGFKENEPLFDYLDIAHNQNVVHTSSADICSKDILNEIIIDNLKKILPYLLKNPVYIKESLEDMEYFGIGNNKESLYTKNVSYHILFDKNKSGSLQSKLDTRILSEIPGKGKNFITINDTVDGTNRKEKVTEYNWFVLEIDHIEGIDDDKVSDYIYKNYIDTHASNKEAKKACFRIVYSGHNSYHFWFYVDNEELNRLCSRELYQAVHKYLNETFFEGKADSKINTPEHFVRAPGCIRPDTGKEQSIQKIKGRHTIHIDNIEELLPKVEEQKPVEVETKNGSVEQAFNLYKDDIPTTNGGRGEII